MRGYPIEQVNDYQQFIPPRSAHSRLSVHGSRAAPPFVVFEGWEESSCPSRLQDATDRRKVPHRLKPGSG